MKPIRLLVAELGFARTGADRAGAVSGRPAREAAVKGILVTASCLLWTVGVATAAEAAGRYRSVLIDDVPHIRQKPDFCGEACAAMYLAKLAASAGTGAAPDQDAVFDASGLDPELGRGCYTKELAVALKRIGFDVGPVWFSVSPDRAQAELDVLFQEVHADLAAGIPSIVCMHYDVPPASSEHFRLILGYDAERDEVIFHEPAERGGAYRRMARSKLYSLWPLKYSPGKWTAIRLRLRPVSVRPSPPAASYTDADYAQHVMQLKRRLPPGFTVVVCKPFVVIGDESPATVRQRSLATVRWAVDRLKRAYFTKDPLRILDIWLFRDRRSYDRYTREIFHDTPTTPFGYFS